MKDLLSRIGLVACYTALVLMAHVFANKNIFFFAMVMVLYLAWLWFNVQVHKQGLDHMVIILIAGCIPLFLIGVIRVPYPPEFPFVYGVVVGTIIAFFKRQ